MRDTSTKKRKSVSDNGFLKKLFNCKTNRLIFFWTTMFIMVIIPFCIWWLYINWNTLFLGFQVYDANGDFTFGIDNFKWVFSQFNTQGSVLILGITNTLKFWLWDFFIIFPLTYVTSFFLYKKIFGYKVFKFVFYLPGIISAVILTSFFKFALQDNGPFMRIISYIAGRDIYVFQNSDMAFKGLLVFNTWTFGGGFVLWVATFSRIPQEVLEYAKIDGINWWREMIYIVFPLTTSFFSLNLFMKFLGIFSAGAPILLLTQGAYGTMTIDYWIFINTLDTKTSQSRVAAFGLILTSISVPISLIVRKITNKIETVEY